MEADTAPTDLGSRIQLPDRDANFVSRARVITIQFLELTTQDGRLEMRLLLSDETGAIDLSRVQSRATPIMVQRR
jgi:hypothetical protein